MKKFIIVINLFALLIINVYSQWTQLSSPTSNNLNTIAFINNSTGYTSGSLSGSILKTTNGCQSWTFLTSGTGSTFNDIYFADANNGLAIGSNGTIVKTTNGGAGWSITLSGSSTLNSIAIAAPTIGIVVGGNPSSFYKTSDLGNTWISGNPPSTNPLRSSQLLGGSYGWVCGDAGIIMKTTDWGVSWIPQNQSSSYNFQKIIFIGGTTGYIFGSGGVIMKTVDGGNNWTLQNSGVTANLYSAFFTSLNNGWAVGASGKIIMTTDGGNNWYPQNSPSTSATYYCIKMLNAQNGYIAGSGGILLKTTNGGGPPMMPIFQKVTNGIVSTDLGSNTMAAWGDFTNSGFQSLVVVPWNDGCWSCRSPIQFYKNNGNGNFARGNSVIIDEVLSCNGVAWGDYDNDGKIDVVITRYFNQTNFLFHNEFPSDFSFVSSGPVVTDVSSSVGCAWCDYDRDGWLDLFVSHGLNQNNALYHNNGNGTFTKITTGAIVNDGGDSRSCAWGDYDNDGWPDLFVVNYSGQNDFLYHNNGNGTFTKISSGPEVNDASWGAGCSWVDYDNDGWLDLFVTDNNQFNRLYHNDHNGNFSLTTLLPSQETGYSYYPTWADIDNDGYIDLFVPKHYSSYNSLYKNNNGTSFTALTSEVVMQDAGNSDAGIFGDFNNDGKMDLFVANGSLSSPTANYLYQNVGATGNYLICKLKGCAPRVGYSNTTGIGARIIIKNGNLQQIREVSGGTGSQGMLWQHFGLGNVSAIDSLIVKWPSGLIQRLTNVAANQTILLDECLVGVEGTFERVPIKYWLSQNYPNPFNPSTLINYEIPKQSMVTLEVFDYLGRKVATLVNSYQKPGSYRFDFNGENFSSGVYFYKLAAGDFVESKKMILIK